MLKETQLKLMMTLISGLMLFTTTAYCQLTDADLNKIRLVVKEEIETSEKRMKEYVDTTEKRMKEHISQEIASEIRPVNTTIVEMDKRLNQIFALVITLVAFIAVVVGVPQIIVAMQRKDIRSPKTRK